MFSTAAAKKAYPYILTVLIAFSASGRPSLCTNVHRSKLSTVMVKAETTPPSAVLNAYLQGVKKRIEHFWVSAKGTNVHASATFHINKDGQASWIELTDMSPIEAVNQSAQDAIFYSSPFLPIPPSLGNQLDLAVEFNSSYQPLSHPGYRRPSDASLEESRRLYKSANIYIKKAGKIDSAIEALNKAGDLTPFDMRVRDKLSEVYIQYCQTKPNAQAISILHEALLNDHDNALLRAKLNQLIAASGKDPKDFEVRLALAREYVKTSRYDDALCEYGEAWLLKNSPSLVAEINKICDQRSNYLNILMRQAAVDACDTAEAHMALQGALLEYEVAAGKTQEPSPELVFNDEFPYADSGSRSLTVKITKDRKVSVDYLSSACPKTITRWATNRIPLTVYVENGAGVFGYRPQLRQFMIDGFATWVRASEGRLSFAVVDNPKQANIVCHWIADPGKAAMNNNEQGITRSVFYYMPSAPNNCLVQSAEISILIVDRRHRQPLSDKAMRAVCLHELGHALGISGHSPYHGDIMYPTFSPDDIPAYMTSRDAATLKHLYQGYEHPH